LPLNPLEKGLSDVFCSNTYTYFDCLVLLR
jgi:hypothetical protein